MPEYRGTCVRDGFASYEQYQQCEHSLCNAHLLRELVYIRERSEGQKQWTEPLVKLLLEIKGSVEAARAVGDERLSDERQAKFLCRYDRITRRAARLNPPPKEEVDPSVPRRKVPKKVHGNPALAVIARLRDKRAEVLRFMTDFAVPFDNNGSERDLRMIKVEQKISGCFRTPEGAAEFCRIRSYLSSARKQGHGVLVAIERAFAGKPLALAPDT